MKDSKNINQSTAEEKSIVEIQEKLSLVQQEIVSLQSQTILLRSPKQLQDLERRSHALTRKQADLITSLHVQRSALSPEIKLDANELVKNGVKKTQE